MSFYAPLGHKLSCKFTHIMLNVAWKQLSVNVLTFTSHILKMDLTERFLIQNKIVLKLYFGRNRISVLWLPSIMNGCNFSKFRFKLWMHSKILPKMSKAPLSSDKWYCPQNYLHNYQNCISNLVGMTWL